MKIQEGKEEQYANYQEVNKRSPYANRCVKFGEDWANLMEKEIAVRPMEDVGAVIFDCAQRTCDQADYDGITGFMYSAGLAGIAEFWVHGDIIRRWHNGQYLSEDDAKKANDAGKTVNTAIFTIGKD